MLLRLLYVPRRYTHQKGFYSKVVENIKKEFSQNKEIKENLEKFRKETSKLEQTDALKQARQKFMKVEEEAQKDANEVIQAARDSFRSSVGKARETEIIKKTIKLSDSISNKAKDAAGRFSKQGEQLRESAAFRKLSEATNIVEKELDSADILSSLYKAPKKLLRRVERSQLHSVTHSQAQRQVEPNDNVSTIDLHKDSKWSANWSKFKDENPYLNKLFEYKMKYDESDNPLVRVTKNFVDRISDIMGGLFQRTDLSTVMTEICKIDPSFDINSFLEDCEKFIIPTILEAMCQNRLDILEDWCHEAVFNVLSQPLREAQKLGTNTATRILDLQNVELVMGKMMEQGPVLILTFQAQQTTSDFDKVAQSTYVMAFCRDQTDLNPLTAWRLVDVAMQVDSL